MGSSGGSTVAGTSVAMTGSDQVVSNVTKRYRGFSIRETSGASGATVVIYDNASAASGTILEEITLLPGETGREWYNTGVIATNGIYLDVVSGAVAGSVRVS